MITDALTPHPYAACYPLVSGALEQSLLSSIQENGLRQPVVLWRDQERDKVWIIDGRNRHRALQQLQGGLREEQVIWQSYQSDEEVRLAVLDYNENRRQMSTAQKSIVAGRILEARAALLAEDEPAPLEPASEESSPQVELGEPMTAEPASASSVEPEDEDLGPSERHDVPEPSMEEPKTPSAPRARAVKPCPPKVRKEVASTLGIGARTAQKGATIVGRGAPQLVSALEEGAVSLEAAYTLTQLDDEDLAEVIAQGKEGMREKAKELKGVARESQERARRDALLGEVEINSVSLSWTERSEAGAREVQLEVTDPDQLYKLLSALKRIGLTDELADAEARGES